MTVQVDRLQLNPNTSAAFVLRLGLNAADALRDVSGNIEPAHLAIQFGQECTRTRPVGQKRRHSGDPFGTEIHHEPPKAE